MSILTLGVGRAAPRFVATFTVSPSVIGTETVVTFGYIVTQGVAVSLSLVPGDGGGAIGSFPDTYTYTTPGTYTIVGTATDADGVVSAEARVITVAIQPVVTAAVVFNDGLTIIVTTSVSTVGEGTATTWAITSTGAAGGNPVVTGTDRVDDTHIRLTLNRAVFNLTETPTLAYTKDNVHSTDVSNGGGLYVANFTGLTITPGADNSVSFPTVNSVEVPSTGDLASVTFSTGRAGGGSTGNGGWTYTLSGGAVTGVYFADGSGTENPKYTFSRIVTSDETGTADYSATVGGVYVTNGGGIRFYVQSVVGVTVTNDSTVLPPSPASLTPLVWLPLGPAPRCYQDVTGLIPVTAAGNPIVLAKNDASGTAGTAGDVSQANPLLQLVLAGSAGDWSGSSDGNDYLQAAAESGFRPGAGASLTLAGWFTFASLPAGYCGLVTKWNNSAGVGEYALYHKIVSGHSRFMWVVSDGAVNSTELTADAVNLAINTRYFVLADYDAVTGGTSIAVNNGTASTAAFTAGGLHVSTNPFRIGTDQGATPLLNGLTTDLFLKRALLTPTEKAALYAYGPGHG